MNVARLRTCAGLATAVVPCAILVHLIAEAAAVGRDGLDLSFVVRHAYFGLLFVAAALWFCATTGIGRCASERRRRCALARADLRGGQGRFGIATLVGANLAFFALTQTVEGVPIAAGAVALSLAIAFSGSVSAALLVFFFGSAFARAALDSVIGHASRRARCPAAPRRARVLAVARHATTTYSLLRPNRPPPVCP